MSNMNAKLIARDRFPIDEGFFVEMVIWEVPQPNVGAVIVTNIGLTMSKTTSVLFVSITRPEKAIINISTATNFRSFL
jgi:hypothetical protein